MIRKLTVVGAVLAALMLTGASPGEAQFQQQSVAFFDATTVHPGAKGFQLADYDRTGHRVIFYPWGGLVTNPSGVILAYHTDQDFSSATSYDAVDLTTLVSPDATGFGTGFLDSASTWSYFVPFRKNYNGTALQTANDLAVRFDLTKALADPGAYETFRINSLPGPPPQTGWITGTHADGYAYYAPFGTPIPADPWFLVHGVFLRYDTSKAFADPAAWEWYDLESQIDARATGFQSVAVKWPWLYLIPYYPGNNLLVRYDLTKPFKDSTSYQAIDLTSLNANAIGYTGAIVAGDYIVLVPWRKRVDLVDLSNQSASVAAAFDTREPLSNAAAWSFIDLTTVHPEAKGYQFGWYDNQRFVHFVPTHNFATGLPPPYVVWDSSQPFASASSWSSYPNTGYPITGAPSSTGAAYDGVYAWLAPYGSTATGGGPGNSGLIARVDATADVDGDGTPDNLDSGDSDGDLLPDVAEHYCGSVTNDGARRPERLDGVFAGADDDGDTLVDEALPGGAGGFDCDGDGYKGSAEAGAPLCGDGRNEDNSDDAVVDDGCPGGPPQAGAFSEGQFNIGGNDQDPCGPASWASDFISGGIPNSTNKVTITDLTSFLAPSRRLDTSPGNPNFSSRWDLVPGRGLFPNWIAINDLTALLGGGTGSPPMLGGVRAFNGPSCPWPP